MKKESMIEKNMASADTFVKSLYTDLHDRIQSYEQEEANADKMRISHTIPELAIIGAISVFLLFVIF
ncbi:hypothetical protein [Bacillus badius]|uniref:Uncharacterized protein n=1 Tax=Bacillus badius TaxID=1455 RepID=A0ABR5ARR8_BACBA|nr:hypothetical protein [Bacillus badius]KIL74041.1 hypothetical protein SD78_3099 [Bacillus badius]KIL77452.1 hypothetical protein SD77_1438 [Bacillus badius]KZN98230.1 hypothetical protein A4244_10755 [Bacillus badius]KZR58516.1 hypothetical protein A3781_16610 [Bacillus badius]MED0667607.1 hypothetical protein [Bacillus badius]